jgi:predicted RNase H-like HicB family nuclease
MRPIIFTVVASWDEEASVWSGHCDEVPAAADAPTLDELLAKIREMTLDVLPDNHPELAPEQVFLQLTALTSAVQDAA